MHDVCCTSDLISAHMTGRHHTAYLQVFSLLLLICWLADLAQIRGQLQASYATPALPSCLFLSWCVTYIKRHYKMSSTHSLLWHAHASHIGLLNKADKQQNTLSNSTTECQTCKLTSDTGFGDTQGGTHQRGMAHKTHLSSPTIRMGCFGLKEILVSLAFLTTFC